MIVRLLTKQVLLHVYLIVKDSLVNNDSLYHIYKIILRRVILSDTTNKVILARSLLRRRNGCNDGTEVGGEVIVELKSQLETFPVKKRINTELFIDREMMLYIQKMRRDRIKKYRTS